MLHSDLNIYSFWLKLIVLGFIDIVFATLICVLASKLISINEKYQRRIFTVYS